MIATGASGFGIMALLVGTEKEIHYKAGSCEPLYDHREFPGESTNISRAFPHFINAANGKVEPFFGEMTMAPILLKLPF